MLSPEDLSLTASNAIAESSARSWPLSASAQLPLCKYNLYLLPDFMQDSNKGSVATVASACTEDASTFNKISWTCPKSG